VIRVHEHAPPPAADLLDRARRIAPATIGHLREIGFVDTGIVPLVTPVSVVGPALTVRMVAPDGGAVHMAIDAALAGDVLVIDTGGDRAHACWGDGTTLAAQTRGIAAVIIDGVATDVQDIRRTRFPVFCRGLSVLTVKAAYTNGEVNGVIGCGGATVSPGDLVMADDNGIVIVSPDEMEPLLAAAEKFEEHEARIRARLAAGESLVKIVQDMSREHQGGKR